MNKVSEWTKHWRINLNETKSTHINFPLRKTNHLSILINELTIPYANTAKYLGMTLDAKLKWKEHIKKKKEELNIKYRKLYWLLGRNSELSVQNKILIYKQILKPAWTYGIQIWGCTKKTNIEIIQTFQNKVLRGIVKAQWYIRNSDLHRDLHINLVKDAIKENAIKYNERLQTHENIEMKTVLDTYNNLRRLKRIKPFELAK
ncbi:putative RNA-directed DNA polymerase from transposon X-element [Formica fusca]